MTFETIQGYEESKGVAKNRNTRYRTAKYIALDSDGQEREYKVRVNNAGGPATIADLGKTRAQIASNHQAAYDALRPETKRGYRRLEPAPCTILPKGNHRGRH